MPPTKELPTNSDSQGHQDVLNELRRQRRDAFFADNPVYEEPSRLDQEPANALASITNTALENQGSHGRVESLPISEPDVASWFAPSEGVVLMQDEKGRFSVHMVTNLTKESPQENYQEYKEKLFADGRLYHGSRLMRNTHIIFQIGQSVFYGRDTEELLGALHQSPVVPQIKTNDPILERHEAAKLTLDAEVPFWPMEPASQRDGTDYLFYLPPNETDPNLPNLSPLVEFFTTKKITTNILGVIGYYNAYIPCNLANYSVIDRMETLHTLPESINMRTAGFHALDYLKMIQGQDRINWRRECLEGDLKRLGWILQDLKDGQPFTEVFNKYNQIWGRPIQLEQGARYLEEERLIEQIKGDADAIYNLEALIARGLALPHEWWKL